MRITTTRFGDIEIADSKILTFKDGLPGFDGLTRFTLITTEDTEPFHWLQALDDKDISLAVINPALLFPDYAPQVPTSVFEELDIEDDEDVLILTVAVIPDELQKMTANLLAPILINVKNNLGKQVILDSNEYELRRPIFDAVRALLEGGAADAGAGKEG